jgi:hypothetical protein
LKAAWLFGYQPEGVVDVEPRVTYMQAAYDDVLERLKGQSNELLAALGGNPGSVTLGSSDETALSQVAYVTNHQLPPGSLYG